ncbi:polysaccharide pyruvyl transferase family protein [Rhodococcus aetherivorans]|uniref:Polysaccharide pyruvyl transferase family protein n=1 Tax=Rhodococcus aetherivorans TaxID=191292 RepID=A0AA46PR93_9NOCA|nr:MULTISPECIES: polysaccharide pyruvyl transferase family protein [Rhodococcus]USC14304.1 polysaccharide pyruvyl transferase family protein [Rhodococcus sp. 11-3]UYF95632.1 polysaccharide pyruvyl transferase family protein [Rhodococcus aetherivorans]
MRIAVLHAYSAQNAGDGLLVEETLELLNEALGGGHEFVLVASYPHTFSHLGTIVHRSKPGVFGYSMHYLKFLRRINDFDVVVGVGGGYLRASNMREFMKGLLVQGPQLYAAASAKHQSVYLPQSVGPFSSIGWALARNLLRKIDLLYVRDDRSLHEAHLDHIVRSPDLAVLAIRSTPYNDDQPISATPVLSVREVRGSVPYRVRLIGERLRHFDGYVQSSVSGNDDRVAMASMNPLEIISRRDLLESPALPRRIVIAMRLHAALMAVQAGHYVIHLAYERKGFGAFEDLGLSDYVMNSNNVDVDEVEMKVRSLLSSEGSRREYRNRLEQSLDRIAESRCALVNDLRRQVSSAGVSI